MKTTTIDREKMDSVMAEAKRFMEDYYRTFNANRADLVNLYRDESAMTFDGQNIQGKEGILASLTSLQRCWLRIDNIDCLPYPLHTLGVDRQPNGLKGGGGAFVMVTGYVWLDDVSVDPNTTRKLLCMAPTMDDPLLETESKYGPAIRIRDRSG